MRKEQTQLPIAFHGCERGIVCNINSACFRPHPWSPTGETCLYASAYMRAEHAAYELARTISGDPSYREAIEILMKVSLLNRSGNQK